MVTTHDVGAPVTRCAVCRIDLKGRFVYVDDGIERLMGFGREELFGKTFLDFVEEADKPLMLSILRQHSRYETNFDSLRLRLRNRKGEVISAIAVIALNFIAGNPVNYQVIIDTERTKSEFTKSPDDSARLALYVQTLLTADQLKFTDACIDALYQYFGVNACLIYHVVKGDPHPVYSKESNPKTGIRALTEPKKLLQWVASSDEEYSVADTEQVRRAIERAGVAPAEFICKFNLLDQQYLLRTKCQESPDPMDTHREVAGYRAVVRLAERLAQPATTSTTLSEKPPASVLDDLRNSLASAMRIASMLGGQKPEARV